MKSGIPWLLLLFLMIGCSQEPEQPAATATAEATLPPTLAPTAPVPTITPTPTVVVKPTITAEPTAIIPAIEVENQTITEVGLIAIESATTADPGWLVVFADNNGVPGAILGYQALTPGETKNVSVAIDPYSATATLYAGLHVDAGDSGEFEYPGNDVAVQLGSDAVLEPFSVTIDMPIPAIDVADQDIAPDGLLNVDGVFALAPNWLVVHAVEDGVIGKAIGQVPIEEGQNNDLVVPIRWRDGTVELIAMLYEDNERPGGFEPSSDLPVLSGGAPVMAQFEVHLPPDILAYDQPVANGVLFLDQVISETPGWVAVYSDLDGQPDRIIGFEKLAAGVNRMLEVEVVETAVSDLLYLSLHEETDIPDEFNFPAGDPPATYEGEVIPPTIVLTNSGNYLITVDQALGETNEVIIPLVVTDLDVWLVIYTETKDGQPDEIVGQLWLPAGVHRDNYVAIPVRLEDSRLLAVLHQDAGTEQQFEYPDGDDVPLQRNRQIIFSPFLLVEHADTGSFSP